MRKTLVHCFATALAALASVQPAAALDDKMTPMATPAQPSAIPLETGPLPGATVKESWHSQYGSSFARNVTEATLTPFLPDHAKATGAAVIVAPGGGFRTLSMQNEGWDVAKALADRGIAAFVLKYRLNQTPASLEEFSRPAPARPRPSFSERMATLGPQIADANAAFALVRARSGKWKVDPCRWLSKSAQFRRLARPKAKFLRQATCHCAGCTSVTAPADRERSFHAGSALDILCVMSHPDSSKTNRLTLCARPECRRMFAVCERCDGGRRYCCAECAAAGRRISLRLAGQVYQASERGRALHAARQARYRARRAQLKRVTHQGAATPSPAPRFPLGSRGHVSAASGPPSGGHGDPTACVRCRRPATFVRTKALSSLHQCRPTQFGPARAERLARTGSRTILHTRVATDARGQRGKPRPKTIFPRQIFARMSNR